MKHECKKKKNVPNYVTRNIIGIKKYIICLILFQQLCGVCTTHIIKTESPVKIRLV